MHSPRTMPVLTATLTGLTNGTTYDTEVRAVNPIGAGSPSEVAEVTPVSPVALSLDGPASKAVTEGSTGTISGKAPAGSSVKVYFRQRGDASFVLRRTLVANQANTFSTSYVATEDYRYYAQAGEMQTPAVLAQIAPTVTGPDSQIVKRNSTVTIHGTGTPGSTVQVAVVTECCRRRQPR